MRRYLPLLLAALLAPWLAAADDKKTTALDALRARLADPKADHEKLRKDVLAFRQAYPGTPEAFQADGLLARLSSPLDKLDPAAIPALERFDWQPKELVAVLGEHRGRHGSVVTAVAYSPDGKLVASGGGAYVRLWEPATLRHRALLGSDNVLAVAFSKDSKFLAAGTSGGYVRVWDVSAEPPKAKLTVSATRAVHAVAFAPDGKSLAAGCYDHVVRQFDLTSDKPKELATLTGHAGAVVAVAYHPDGRLLVTGSHDNTVRVWDPSGKEPGPKATLEGHDKPVHAVALTARGDLLAAGVADGSICLWPFPAADKAKPKAQVKARAGAVNALAFAPGGKSLASAGSDGVVRLWDVGGAKPLEKAALEGHVGQATGVAFAPDGKQLVSGGLDWTARAWDVAAAKPAQRFAPWSHLSHVYSAAFAPDGQLVATGSEDRTVRLWDVTRPPFKPKTTFKGDNAQVYQVAFAPDGKKLAAAGNHTTVRQYDPATGKDLLSLSGHPGAVNGLAYSPDGNLLLAASDKLLVYWNATTGREIRRFDGHQTRINCLAYSPDGRFALTGSGVHEVKDGQYVYKNGKPVYIDCVLRLWDLENFREAQAIKDQPTPFYSAAFAPDGGWAFTGNLEPAARRWQLKDRALNEGAPVKAGSAYVHSMVFAPDGQTLATRGLDGNKVILWDMPAGKRVKEWAFPERVGALACAPDSRHLAVTLGTGVVYILRVTPASGK